MNWNGSNSVERIGTGISFQLSILLLSYLRVLNVRARVLHAEPVRQAVDVKRKDNAAATCASVSQTARTICRSVRYEP